MRVPGQRRREIRTVLGGAVRAAKIRAAGHGCSAVFVFDERAIVAVYVMPRALDRLAVWCEVDPYEGAWVTAVKHGRVSQTVPPVGRAAAV